MRSPARPPSSLVALALGSLALAAGLAACSPDPEGGAGDAPIADVEHDPWVVLNNVDGYPNLAFRCRAGDGLYVTRSADDSADTLVVVPNDPACAEDAATSGGRTPEVIGPGTTLPR